MYVNDSEDLREAVLKALKSYGLKPRFKRDVHKRKPNDDIRSSSHSSIFKLPIEQLPSTDVCLDCGACVSVPQIVVQLCDRIYSDIHIEGIFRKNGSQARQHDIKVYLEKGGTVQSNHHVIDIAVLLKEFLRCLPNPLIPYCLHDDLIKCLTFKEKSLEPMMLLCFMLPPANLNLLAYLMQFFAHVHSQSANNKMDAHNLSVVISPNVMPSTSRNTVMCSNSLIRAENCRLIVQKLIENASLIGVLPDGITAQTPSSSLPPTVNTSHEELREIHRRKRRSASLTRMFNGFKRMVAKNNASEESNGCETNEPNTPCTPVILPSSAKKRKSCERDHALGFSSKKRYDQSDNNLEAPVVTKKKFFSSHSATNLKKSTTSLKEKARKSFSGTGLKLSRLKLRKSKSKDKGLDTTDENDLDAPMNSGEMERCESKVDITEEAYVRVPKREYELMEKRVAQIENKISQEFGRTDLSDEQLAQPATKKRESVENVVNEYNKTLDKVEQLNKTCDNLADQLKRDLKIRRSGEHKIMRSPSARKISSIRRRSKDRGNKTNPLARHQSLNIHDKPLSYKLDRNRSIRRQKPNTSQNLIHRSNSRGSPKHHGVHKGRITRQTAPRRAETFHVNRKTQKPQNWQCAENVIAKAIPAYLQLNEPRRASIAKLKEQNAGMVMAKAKLFDHFADGSDHLGSDSTQNDRKIQRYQSSRADARPQLNGFSRQGTFQTRKSLADTDSSSNKENVVAKPRLSETLENIIYDTCKVRTPDMPIIKKPLTGNRNLSIRQTRENITSTPLAVHPLAASDYTPRKSPRLLEMKMRQLISSK